MVLGHLGVVLGHLGVSWGGLGRSWDSLRLLLAAPWRSWGGLGVSWGRSWGVLGRSWAILGPPEAILDRFGVVLGSIWGGFEIDLDGFGVDVG